MEYTFEATVKSVNRNVSDFINQDGEVVHMDQAYWGAEGEIGNVFFNPLADVPTPPVGTRFTVTLVAIEED